MRDGLLIAAIVAVAAAVMVGWAAGGVVLRRRSCRGRSRRDLRRITRPIVPPGWLPLLARRDPGSLGGIAVDGTGAPLVRGALGELFDLLRAAELRSEGCVCGTVTAAAPSHASTSPCEGLEPVGWGDTPRNGLQTLTGPSRGLSGDKPWWCEVCGGVGWVNVNVYASGGMPDPSRMRCVCTGGPRPETTR